MLERISRVEDNIEEIDILYKEDGISKKFQTQNIQDIWNTMKKSKSKLSIIEMKQRVNSKLKA